MLPQPEYDVVGAVKDEQTLVRAAQDLKPDIVVADIDMPRLDTIKTTRQLCKAVPDCRVIFMSSHGDPNTMAAAYAAGVSAYLVKGASPTLTAAIRAVIDHPGKPREWDTVPSVKSS